MRAKAGSQELNPGLPHGWQGVSFLSYLYCLPESLLVEGWCQELKLRIKARPFGVEYGHSSHYQGSGKGVEQPGLELAPIWNAGFVGTGFTC